MYDRLVHHRSGSRRHRPTKDVDAIVDVTSYAKYTALSERLHALGLAEDTTPAHRSAGGGMVT